MSDPSGPDCEAVGMGVNRARESGVDQRPDTLTRLSRFAVVCAAAVAALWFLYKIRVVLLIVLVGVAIAYALAPLVNAFSGNRPQLRLLGIAAAYVVVFGGLVTATLLGFRPVAEDVRIFATTLPAAVQRVDAWIARTSADAQRTLPPQLKGQPDSRPANFIGSRLQSLLSNLGQYAVGAATVGQSFATLAAAGVLALILSTFFLGDPHYFRRQVFAVVPVAYREDAETLLREIDLVLAAFVRGQITIAVIVGLAATLGMRLLGVKYAVILGLFTAVTQLIPQVGGAIGLIAAVALTALQTPALALGVFVLYAVLYQVSGNVLGPWVMGKAVQLNPLVILLATMVGTVLGGVAGLLLSVPVVAVAKVVWNFGYARLAPKWGLGSVEESRTMAASSDSRAADPRVSSPQLP